MDASHSAELITDVNRTASRFVVSVFTLLIAASVRASITWYVELEMCFIKKANMLFISQSLSGQVCAASAVI